MNLVGLGDGHAAGVYVRRSCLLAQAAVGSMATTTVPRACPAATCRIAAGVSLKGYGPSITGLAEERLILWFAPPEGKEGLPI